MDEIFNKLVESELLNEETKASLVEAFNAKLEEAITVAKADAEVAVREQLTEQFLTEKQLIIDALDTKNEEFMKRHLQEMLEDIEAFRDLEAEHAEKLVEAKAEMASALKADIKELVEKLDQYNTEWMQEHFVELEESINEVKQIQFGKEIFEAVAKTFEKNFSDTNATLNALKEAEEKLEATTKELNESKTALDRSAREHKLNAVLENLHGRPREVMAQILSNVPTDKLEEGYNKFIGRVLNEGKTEKESVETPVLAESTQVTLEEGDKVVTGNNTEAVLESINDKASLLSPEDQARIAKLAGIID